MDLIQKERIHQQKYANLIEALNHCTAYKRSSLRFFLNIVSVEDLGKEKSNDEIQKELFYKAKSLYQEFTYTKIEDADFIVILDEYHIRGISTSLGFTDKNLRHLSTDNLEDLSTDFELKKTLHMLLDRFSTNENLRIEYDYFTDYWSSIERLASLGVLEAHGVIAVKLCEACNELCEVLCSLSKEYGEDVNASKDDYFYVCLAEGCYNSAKIPSKEVVSYKTNVDLIFNFYISLYK